MAETGNTTRTQLINLEGLSTFLEESKKIFEPTLPPGTDGQVLKLSSGKPTWEVSNEFDEIHAKEMIAGSAQIDLVNSKRVKIDGQIDSPQLELVANKVVINEQLGAETLRLESPSVKGNADTSSRLKTAVSLTITDGSHTSEGVDFDGSKAISIKLPSTIAATFSGNLTGDIAGNATTATTAEKLGSSAGDTTKPIYFSEGKPTETGYTFADAISSSAADNNKKLPTSSAIISYVGNEISSALRASDAMIYKGTIGEGGTVQALPSTTALTGWTYKVITAGTYAGVSCEVGDMIICLTDGSSTQSATWTVVQSNIDGAVTSGVTSATDGHIPLFSGTTGKVIKSSSKAIVTSITDSTDIPTDKAVKAYVDGLVNDINDTIGNVETLLANI